MNFYLDCFLTFAKIGAFTFGGGYAMIAVVQREVVEKKKWLSAEEFIDLLAISQTLPGAWAVNIATYVGYKMRKQKGSLVAALGTILPSFVIMLLIAMFFAHFQDNAVVNKMFKAIRPAVVALIVVPVFTTARQLRLNVATVVIPVLSAVLIWLFGVSPIYIILAVGAFGAFYGYFIDRNKKIKS